MAHLKQYVIKDGDTIQLVAQKVLGDASRGLELITLNDLTYPFIARRDFPPTKGVKLPGDTILVPTEGEQYTSGTSVTDPELEIYKSDLLLVTDSDSPFGGGDLQSDLYGDLQTVKGTLGLKYALLHRLMTPTGTLPYHPDYGSNFHHLIGNRSDPDWQQKCVLEIARTFRSDPRVVDVSEIKVSTTGTATVIKCKVTTPSVSFEVAEQV